MVGIAHPTKIALLQLVQDVRGDKGDKGDKGDNLSSSPSLLPTLLIAPTSVVGNWQKEIAKFAPHLKAMVHHGSDRYSKAFIQSQQGKGILTR